MDSTHYRLIFDVEKNAFEPKLARKWSAFPRVIQILKNVGNYFKNSLIIHEQNTKKIIAVKESLYVIKHTSIFSATSIFKILS